MIKSVIKTFVGTSLIEFPGRIASIVFIGGCNLRCPFCHNPELVLPELITQQPSIPEDEVIEDLKKRKGFIEGVSFTGGEPLLYPGLPDLLKRIKEELGLSIKLDVNGTLPDRLKAVLPYVDFIAMDIKTAPEKYYLATGNGTTFEQIEESIKIIKGTDDYEFRTTMVPNIVDIDDVKEICKRIKRVKKYVLQRYRNGKTLSPEFSNVYPYPKGYLKEVARSIAECAEIVEIRE